MQAAANVCFHGVSCRVPPSYARNRGSKPLGSAKSEKGQRLCALAFLLMGAVQAAPGAPAPHRPSFPESIQVSGPGLQSLQPARRVSHRRGSVHSAFHSRPANEPSG